MPYKHTIEAAESRHAAMAEQRAKQIALDKVSRVVRKSAVNGLDMQHFFGTSLRPNAVIDLPHKICVEGPATETLTIEANSDLGLPHELLEAILSHLPVLDLIIATGVNMTFRTIVQESPTLQRKLFLRATNEPRRFVRLEHPDWGYEVAVATQEEYADVDDADEYERDGTQWGVAREAVTPSPFLISEDDQDRSRTERHRETEVVCFTDDHNASFASLPPRRVRTVLDALADRVAERLAGRLEHTGNNGDAGWLTADQAAAYIGAPRSRVYDLVAQRRVEHRKDGRKLLFRKQWLDAAIDGGER